jgi:drug/metabolite transporter (DMT)-like permease
MKMIIGILLIVLGIVALSYQGFTFFTTERAVDIGPLAIDVQKPHTIIFHPILGVVALVIGGLIIMSSRPKALV